MKRLMFFFFACFFILSSCATIPRKTISQGDLADLKGYWDGLRSISIQKSQVQTHVDMEIFNDTLPLKGTITITLYSLMDKRAYPFDNGEIDREGNLVIKLPDNARVVLGLYKGRGKTKLYGSIYQSGGEGVLTLLKIR